MTASTQFKYLFIHVMKTGGTSFADVIDANFPLEHRYPGAVMQGETNPLKKMEAYLFVPGIVAEVNAHPDRYRIVAGHVPYATRELLEQRYVTMTVLREPVSRTVSYLKHCRRYHTEHMDKPLEAIYEDDWFHASFIANYQTKLFAMTARESLAEIRYGDYEPRLPPRSELGDSEEVSPELKSLTARGNGRFCMECFAASTGVIELDDQRFTRAKENLATTDVVGVTEDYGNFLQTLVERYDWQVDSMSHRHAGGDEDISDELRRRIVSDNEMDTELYHYARSLAHRAAPTYN